MNLLSHIWPSSKTVSVIGICKNAGKTVTLNALVKEASEAGIQPGIISSGRDGEAVDAVTFKEKPAVHVKKGYYIVSLERLICSDRTTAVLEIVETTGFNTPLGRVVIARVATPGTVEISGPGSMSKIKKMTDKLHAYGADIVFMDGSIDRKALSAPVISEATVLASGAAYAGSMEKVIKDTAHTVNLLSLPLAPDGILKEARELINKKQSSIIMRDGTWETYSTRTTLTGAKLLEGLITGNTSTILLHGALTKRSLPKNKDGLEITVIVRDPTCIFLNPEELRILRGRGYSFKVLYSSPVSAVTINPHSPDGFDFDSEEFLARMKETLNPVPVANVIRLHP
jgi:hypothetical protein